MNFLAMEQNHHRLTVDNDRQSSLPTSRRPSAILAALRRPSQAFALSAVQAFLNQRRNMVGLFNNHGNIQTNTNDIDKEDLKLNEEQGNDAVTTILSAFYAKLLVVLGMAFPITEILSKEVTTSFYQGFYLYLYVGSISFLIVIYTTVAKEKAVNSLLSSFQNQSNVESTSVRIGSNQSKRYGSFYLRLGAIAFGIGSMVYSGLEFVRYFEAKHYANCDTNVLHAITPAARTILTLLQMQFIFLSSKDLELRKIKNLARFGLMHMIATDLCEWLYVLVEETKHEMIHLAVNSEESCGNIPYESHDEEFTSVDLQEDLGFNSSQSFTEEDIHKASHDEEQYNDTETLMHEKFCQEELVTGSLVMNSSPFLFPCTIEYSLICAVILFEMWKKMRTFTPRKSVKLAEKKCNAQKEQNIYLFNNLGGSPVNSENHITVDCSSAHKGLFAGIMVIVFTIISLIMFFVLTQDHTNSKEARRRHILAQVEVNSVELVLYVITILATIVAMIRMRAMKYERKLKAEGQAGIGLDNTLLVVAQTGVFIYSMFSIIGNCFTSKGSITISLLAEVFSFLQTSLQTIFVLDSWWRRCGNTKQSLEKPGRELITFLIISNMALWTINSLEKNKAEFNPDQIAFFGEWAWTIITHISMPLAIFYRFHSTICLFEIWKNAYKVKSNMNAPVITLN